MHPLSETSYPRTAAVQLWTQVALTQTRSPLSGRSVLLFVLPQVHTRNASGEKNK